MRIFAERDLREFTEERLISAQQEINNLNSDTLLNINQPDFLHALEERYGIDPLTLHSESVSLSEKEAQIAAERFPANFNVHPGELYPKQIITYHVPYSGMRELLRMKPSSFIRWSIDVEASNAEITFSIVNWNNDGAAIKREADHTLAQIKAQAINVQKQVEGFNARLGSTLQQMFESRKELLLSRANLLASLGVPVRSRQHVPQTFRIPEVKIKPTITRPSVPSGAYKPEPSLGDDVYTNILELLHSFGREIERHPSLYSGKGEEALRDNFLIHLTPHFDSSTGETFNRRGKTDILIRHEGQNAFVAECKIWKGPKQHLRTIDQILGYLTWRDSKAAIIYFVRTKELQPVLDSIAVGTRTHGSYVEALDTARDGYSRYRFHLPEDATRNVFLGVLCFHYPE